MARDEGDENTARSRTIAAGRFAVENDDPLGTRIVIDRGDERRSLWDAGLNTGTTPQSAVDSWGVPAPASGASIPTDASSTAASSAESEKWTVRT